MAWAENNYIETRFVGGMNCSVEPHTLDRDTGELPDIMNMVCRTQGLRTRKGWERISDLSAEYGTVPLNAPSALFNFEYEPDLPTEATGDSGDDATDDSGDDATDGTAVLPYVDNDDESSGGGHGGGGRVRPKPEPDTPVQEPVEAWSVTGPASIYPYVPFELAITRNSGTGRAAWVYGILSPSSAGSCKWTNSYPAESSTGVWKSNVLVKNLKRTIEDVIFKAGASSAAYGQCQLDYALYGFYPELPDAVTVGEEFTFTVECRDVNVITGYQGNGREVYLAWTFLNGSGQEVQGTVNVTGTSWKNGVLTAKGVANTTEGVTLRLTATFLGEAHYDEAAINVGEVGLEVDECPIALHIYGKGDTLKLSATGGFSPSHLSVACELDGEPVSVNDVLELETAENGSRDISFASGWSESNVWSKGVRAKSVSANGGSTLRIVFAYANGEDRFTATADIEIEKTIEGTLIASPSSIYSGDTVALTATISGNVDVGLDASRVPFSLMFLSHADGDGFTVTTDKDITDDENWSESNAVLVCQLNAVISGASAGTLRYCLGMSGEIMDYVDIAVVIPDYEVILLEAINERRLVKGLSALTASDVELYASINGITIYEEYASLAADCMYGYVKNKDDLTNIIVYSSANATGISLSGSGFADSSAWLSDTYNKVIQACESYKTPSGGDIWNNVVEASIYKKGDSDKVYFSDESGMASAAASARSSALTLYDGNETESGQVSRIDTGLAYASYSCRAAHNVSNKNVQCDVETRFYKYKLSTSIPISARITISGRVVLEEQYSRSGSTSTSTEDGGRISTSYNQQANASPVFSEYMAFGPSMSSALSRAFSLGSGMSYGESVSATVSRTLAAWVMLLNYDFAHKAGN